MYIRMKRERERDVLVLYIKCYVLLEKIKDVDPNDLNDKFFGYQVTHIHYYKHNSTIVTQT